MTVYTFCIDSVVQGYHKYKSVWDNPLGDENLPCEWETGYSHNPQAVAVKKMIDGTLKVVRHVPRKISSICSLFSRRGGSIACRVTGHWQYSSDSPQGGLELPCILTFTMASAKEYSKTKKVFESTLPLLFVVAEKQKTWSGHARLRAKVAMKEGLLNVWVSQSIGQSQLVNEYCYLLNSGFTRTRSQILCS